MKNFKKLFALLIAAVLLLSMSVATFAAPKTDNNITLTGGKAGHTYKLYQIFTGEVKTVGSEEQLTNIQWGSDANDTFKDAYATAAAAAKEIADNDDARATAQRFVTNEYLGTGTAQTLSEDGNVSFTNLTDGYYVVIDTSGPDTVTEGDYYSAYIVQVVKPVNMALKGSAPTSEKKVDDKNDSNTTEDATTWQDSADYDIGDDVPFQLKATTADNVAAYKKYHITFQDKQSDGLDAPESFTITVPGTTETMTLPYNATDAVTKDVTFTTGESADAVSTVVTIKAEKVAAASGNTFAIKVSFETKPTGSYLPAGLNSQQILINYASKLNNDAVIGSTGNQNESYITYSNKPESTDDSEEGKTPNDKVTVFTYSLKVDKTDEDGNALKGAGFTLYKLNAASTATYKYEAVGNEVKGTDLTTFTWKGLDDGSYKLVETTVPTGFNKADDITFDVVATHDTVNADPKLTELKVENVTPSGTTISANKDANATEATTDSYEVATEYDATAAYYTKEGEEYTAAAVADAEVFTAGTYYTKTTTTTMNANLETTVINKSGAVLPSTGGIGTTIFYVVGAILVLGAAILLVTKRRVNAQ